MPSLENPCTCMFITLLSNSNSHIYIYQLLKQWACTMVNCTWSERITLQCSYRTGNHLNAYVVEWTVNFGAIATIINKDNVMEPLSVELNSISEAMYRCQLTIESNSPGSDFLYGLDIDLYKGM